MLIRDTGSDSHSAELDRKIDMWIEGQCIRWAWRPRTEQRVGYTKEKSFLSVCPLYRELSRAMVAAEKAYEEYLAPDTSGLLEPVRWLKGFLGCYAECVMS